MRVTVIDFKIARPNFFVSKKSDVYRYLKIRAFVALMKSGVNIGQLVMRFMYSMFIITFCLR